jgi:hypothetical protein
MCIDQRRPRANFALATGQICFENAVTTLQPRAAWRKKRSTLSEARNTKRATRSA